MVIFMTFAKGQYPRTPSFHQNTWDLWMFIQSGHWNNVVIKSCNCTALCPQTQASVAICCQEMVSRGFGIERHQAKPFVFDVAVELRQPSRQPDGQHSIICVFWRRSFWGNKTEVCQQSLEILRRTSFPFGRAAFFADLRVPQPTPNMGMIGSSIPTSKKNHKQFFWIYFSK